LAWRASPTIARSGKPWKAGGDVAINTGEAHGLKALLSREVEGRPFTWFDTGNPPALIEARAAYQEPDAPNILEKGNEAIWFVDDQVIKFSDDQKFIANRVKRVAQLESFVPQVTASTTHMYRYGKVQGVVLSDCITLPLFDQLLNHCRSFWKRASLDAPSKLAFKASCRKFYRDKTFERVELFYKTFGKQDGTQAINGLPMPTLHSLLEALDWDWLSNGTAGSVPRGLSL
jgi:hypothetical protein